MLLFELGVLFFFVLQALRDLLFVLCLFVFMLFDKMCVCVYSIID